VCHITSAVQEFQSLLGVNMMLLLPVLRSATYCSLKFEHMVDANGVLYIEVRGVCVCVCVCVCVVLCCVVFPTHSSAVLL
jgi:hypothetical protein